MCNMVQLRELGDSRALSLAPFGELQFICYYTDMEMTVESKAKYVTDSMHRHRHCAGTSVLLEHGQ